MFLSQLQIVEERENPWFGFFIEQLKEFFFNQVYFYCCWWFGQLVQPFCFHWFNTLKLDFYKFMGTLTIFCWSFSFKLLWAKLHRERFVCCSFFAVILQKNKVSLFFFFSFYLIECSFFDFFFIKKRRVSCEYLKGAAIHDKTYIRMLELNFDGLEFSLFPIFFLQSFIEKQL